MLFSLVCLLQKYTFGVLTFSYTWLYSNISRSGSFDQIEFNCNKHFENIAKTIHCAQPALTHLQA